MPVTSADLNNISFTTDDIQDIYMPSAIDNYKRKIAVELERRRRCATQCECSNPDSNHSPVRSSRLVCDEIRETDMCLPPVGPPVVVLDDLDIFIIKKTKSSIEKEALPQEQVVKSYQPTIISSPDTNVCFQAHIHRRISVKHAESEDEEECVKRATFKTELSALNYANKNTIDIRRKVDLDEGSTSASVVTEPETAVITRERASSLRKYALIHKVDTMMIDNEEIVPSSSSSSSPEDSSLNEVSSNSDTLNNINLDNFETKIRVRKTKTPRPALVIEDNVDNRLG